jgi:subtilisin family serine protease
VNVIVVFSSKADVPGFLKSIEASGGSMRHRYENVLNGAALSVPATAVAGLSKNPNISRMEIDGIAKASETQPSPPSWGLDRIDQRTLPLSSSYTYPFSGSGVSAYVVDTGIRPSHVEFQTRVLPGFSSIADGNGSNDCNGHGTHVAGTIGGSSTGVAKSVSLIPVRVLDCTGSGSWSGIIAGLDWIAAHHTAGVPAVANMSLGGGASSTVDQAVANLTADGVLVVVAAGNSNADACGYSPARAASALTVGATTSTDARASYSNFGACLDLFAPGSSISSAYHTSDTAYSSLSGTSMASPHVAGSAAVVLSQTPSLTPAEVSSKILSASSSNLVSSAGTNSPNRLLFQDPQSTVVAPSIPTAPSNVLASAGKRSAKVSWTRGQDGGSPLTSQVINVYSKGVKITSLQVSASAVSATITNLTAGVAYRFSVSAANSVGSSPESSLSNEVIPRR